MLNYGTIPILHFLLRDKSSGSEVGGKRNHVYHPSGVRGQSHRQSK